MQFKYHTLTFIFTRVFRTLGRLFLHLTSIVHGSFSSMMFTFLFQSQKIFFMNQFIEFSYKNIKWFNKGVKSSHRVVTDLALGFRPLRVRVIWVVTQRFLEVTQKHRVKTQITSANLLLDLLFKWATNSSFFRVVSCSSSNLSVITAKQRWIIYEQMTAKHMQNGSETKNVRIIGMMPKKRSIKRNKMKR